MYTILTVNLPSLTNLAPFSDHIPYEFRKPVLCLRHAKHLDLTYSELHKAILAATYSINHYSILNLVRSFFLMSLFLPLLSRSILAAKYIRLPNARRPTIIPIFVPSSAYPISAALTICVCS